MLRDEGVQDAGPRVVVDGGPASGQEEAVHEEEGRAGNSSRAPILDKKQPTDQRHFKHAYNSSQTWT
jgi:hypothetical protein